MQNLAEILANSNFDAVGITDAALMDDDLSRLRQWVELGMSGSLGYMNRSLDTRHDLRNIFPKVKSVIVTLTAIKKVKPHTPTIAAFAHNFPDYHFEIKNRLNRLLVELQATDSTIEGRVVVDSAPAFEKSLAVRAGLGWIGRNSVLINPSLGSYTHIGLLLINKELEYNSNVIEDGCPSKCKLCYQHCPNGAINDNRTIDSRRCIAAITIEKTESSHPLHSHIFGCDRCIEACPFNRYVEVMEPTINEDWQTITKSDFRKRFGNTSLARVPLEKIKINALAAEQHTEQ